jgi:hypothetical protein
MYYERFYGFYASYQFTNYFFCFIRGLSLAASLYHQSGNKCISAYRNVHGILQLLRFVSLFGENQRDLQWTGKNQIDIKYRALRKEFDLF